MTDALSDYEKCVVANVREYGCHVVSVFDPDDVSPSFSYSVGFWETVGQPEVIILGLDSEMGHFAINETLRQCRAGLTLHDGGSIDHLFEEYDVTCVARTVRADFLVRDFFNSAIWYRELRTGLPLEGALQLVWGYNGLLPWDDGVPPEIHEDQPQLYSGKPH